MIATPPRTELVDRMFHDLVRTRAQTERRSRRLTRASACEVTWARAAELAASARSRSRDPESQFDR
jgi:hypothetical protein